MTDLVRLIDEQIAEYERKIKAMRAARAVLADEPAPQAPSTPIQRNGAARPVTGVRTTVHGRLAEPADALRNAIKGRPGIPRDEVLGALAGHVKTKKKDQRKALNGTIWWLIAKAGHVREEGGKLYLTPEGELATGE